MYKHEGKPSQAKALAQVVYVHTTYMSEYKLNFSHSFHLLSFDSFVFISTGILFKRTTEYRNRQRPIKYITIVRGDSDIEVYMLHAIRRICVYYT